MDLIKLTDEYVLTYIVKPGVKAYYVSDDYNGVHCSTSILSAFRFLSRNNAHIVALNLNDTYKLDFSIEKVEV